MTSTPNADRDRALFDKIAQEYTHKDTYVPSQRARKLRLRQTLQMVSSQLEGPIDVLEVGCGAGFSARYLEGLYRSYTGLDYSAELIKLARSLHPLPNAEFICSDFMQFECDKRFDAIFMIGVLHHMEEIDGALNTSYALLKPGGFFVANEPQPNNPLISWSRKIRARLDDAYSEDQIELEVSEIRQYLDAAGFVDISSKPQGLFSTPLAEVTLQPELIFKPISSILCRIDQSMEGRMARVINKLTWNCIVAGRKPLSTS